MRANFVEMGTRGVGRSVRNVYLVWENDPLDGEETVAKVFSDENKAKEFIENRDKMTGCRYSIQEMALD